MAFVETNLPCPKCDSSDAYGIDSNGWGHCFSCGANVKEGDEHTSPSVNERVITNRVIPMQPRTSNTEPYSASQGLIYKPMLDRKLNANTLEHYDVGFRGSDLVFSYANGDAAKVRIGGNKDFRIEGNWKDNPTLFGQERFSEGGKFVIVTEGEIDAMSAYQMMDSRTPCVSVRNGAQSALKDCKANFSYLDSFETVVFCFDNDPAGQEAVDKCAELFSHKAKVMKIANGFKDANDYLKDNKKDKFVDAFWRAERWTPDGVIDMASLYDEVMKPLAKAEADYPFEGLNKLTYGLRYQELVTVTAGSGLGKSQFLREMVWHLIQTTNENIGLIFLEEGERKTGLSLMSLAADKPLHLPDTEASQKEKDDAFQSTLGTGRIFGLTKFGSSDIDTIVNRVRHFAKAMDCKYVFLDHISIVVSAQSNGDERKAIDEIMTKLRMLVQETGISLICVSHLKRPENKGHEEGAATSLAQLRGSGSIAQLSDMVLGLERNGQAEDESQRNTTRVRVLKNRFSGITGPACNLLYSHETGRMSETFEDEDEAL